MTAAASPTLWVDVDDLVYYLAHHNRPSGIQRVTFEMCRALHVLDDGAGRVGFVRRDGGPLDLVTIAWTELETAFLATAGNAAAEEPGSRQEIVSQSHRTVDVFLHGLMDQGRVFLALAHLFGRLGSHAAEGVKAFFVHCLARIGASRRPTAMHTADGRYGGGSASGIALRDLVSPGDSLVVLGSPWSHHDYVHTVRWARDTMRMRFALLIHDLIPLRRPEWCDRAVIIAFNNWHRAVLPLADAVFSNSAATAADLTAWMGENRIPLAQPVRPLPIGTGLQLPRAALPAASDGVASRPSLPACGTYALFVSTIEARKNHVLLFRVWRRLLRELPADQVPTLVFAGRLGWLVNDLMQQLENAQWLGGKIRFVRDPTDTELGALYEGCLFTLFPSLYEGWGLPVSESLALGCPCLSSNRTSLPEAGGDLARYFDPENADDAYRAIHDVITDGAGLQAWRLRIAREFRPVPWASSATALRAAMAALDADRP
jgi:glycosyltransferase involved in cell wall biosynthesis